MICKKCGREISDQAKFCTYCGATAVVDTGADAAGVGVTGADATGVDAVAAMVADAVAEAAAEPSAATGADTAAEVFGEVAMQPAPYDAAQPAEAPAPPAPYDAMPTEAPVAYDAPPAPYDAAPASAEGLEPGLPYGAPQPAPAPYDAPPAPYDAAPTPAPYGAPLPAPASPQAMYGAAQPPQAKKSRAGLIVGIIIAVVVVLGAAVAVGGYFIYQGWVADAADTQTTTTDGPKAATDPKTTPDSGTQPEPKPDSGSTVSPDSNDGPAPKSLADFKNPYVVLDTPELKITIDVGSGIIEDSIIFYDVYCVVENKSDKTLFFSIEDTSGDGFLGNEYDVYLLRDYLSYDSDDWDFTPGESMARLSFSSDKVDKKITNFKAKLIAYDAESYQEFAIYDLEIPEL